MAKLGAPLSPAKVRSLLMASGTPQVAGPGVPLLNQFRGDSLSQRIGPLPNLPVALKKI